MAPTGTWSLGARAGDFFVEVSKLNQDDIFEVEGTFYAPAKG